jgi:16S rRNA processing protein RimM
MMAEGLRLVGRVARAHGNRGQVIVNLETDFAEDRFRLGAVLLVGGADGPRPLAITAVRFHQGRPVVGLEGVRTMTEAEALAGAELWMEAASLAPLPEGTFFHHDLVGCEVRDRQGAIIGRVAAVEGPMDRSNLVVEGAQGEVLIPLVADICQAVDTSARTIVVTLPEGLLELNQAGRRAKS